MSMGLSQERARVLFFVAAGIVRQSLAGLPQKGVAGCRSGLECPVDEHPCKWMECARRASTASRAASSSTRPGAYPWPWSRMAIRITRAGAMPRSSLRRTRSQSWRAAWVPDLPKPKPRYLTARRCNWARPAFRCIRRDTSWARRRCLSNMRARASSSQATTNARPIRRQQRSSPSPLLVFVTEATFGLPVFNHPDPQAEIEKLLASLEVFPQSCHVAGCYALGKTQRLIAELSAPAMTKPSTFTVR